MSDNIPLLAYGTTAVNPSVVVDIVF